MIILYLRFDPLILAPIVFSILTIFGRKGKKEEKGDQDKAEKTPAVQEPVKQVLGPDASATGNPPADNPSIPSEDQSASDETSLNKLLQSLLQEMPFASPSEAESSETLTSSTTDWVPPRATPPSRPMVVVSGEKGERVLAPVQSEEHSFLNKNPQASEPELRSPIQTPNSSASQGRKAEQIDQEAKKPSKPDRRERPEAKPQASELATKTTRNFEHIFDLTQGAFNMPGLVVVNGQLGSGKTSLASSLARTYLEKGAACVLVAYDESVSSLRDSIRKTGWDAAQYESQFRLLIVDGFATQSESLSLEPYYVEKPFDLDNLTETLVRSSQVFMGSKVQIILDSITGLAVRTPQNEFLRKFRDLLNKTKESSMTLVATVDESKLSKDLTGPLEDPATCVVDLQKDGEKSGRLRVRKLNGSVAKSEPEEFEIEPGSGLLFV